MARTKQSEKNNKVHHKVENNQQLARTKASEIARKSRSLASFDPNKVLLKLKYNAGFKRSIRPTYQNMYLLKTKREIEEKMNFTIPELVNQQVDSNYFEENAEKIELKRKEGEVALFIAGLKQKEENKKILEIERKLKDEYTKLTENKKVKEIKVLEANDYAVKLLEMEEKNRKIKQAKKNEKPLLAKKEKIPKKIKKPEDKTTARERIEKALKNLRK